MGQVPEYAIIGAGRIAKHFCHYLDLLNIPYRQWSRKADPAYARLEAIVAKCNPVLILITDGSIEAFIKSHPFLQDKILVHFSGSLHTPLAHGAHPLMAFNAEQYPLDLYQKICFITEENSLPFKELLPGLKNPTFAIPHQLKSFYHAMCVISGNFTTMLWQKFFSELETVFKIPRENIYPYLQQICLNLQSNAQLALTGPLVRNDQATMAANLQALTNDPFQKIYHAFVEVYQAGVTNNEYP